MNIRGNKLDTSYGYNDDEYTIADFYEKQSFIERAIMIFSKDTKDTIEERIDSLENRVSNLQYEIRLAKILFSFIDIRKSISEIRVLVS